MVVVPRLGATSNESIGQAVPLMTKGTSPAGVTSPAGAGQPPGLGHTPRLMLPNLAHWAVKALVLQDFTQHCVARWCALPPEV